MRERAPWSGAGAVLLLLVAGLALLGPLLSTTDPDRILDPLRAARLAPAAGHWLGTDPLSRDVLARLLHGARRSLLMALCASTVSSALGLVLGALSGLVAGAWDRVAMTVLDALMALPRLVLLLVVMALLGERVSPAQRTVTVTLTLALSGWMGPCRIVRAEALSLREREFLVAARVLGLPLWRILFAHLLPCCLPLWLWAWAQGFSAALLFEGALSFLGLGVMPPTASLGSMIWEGRACLDAWWVSAFPGLFLLLAALGAQLLADAWRERLDPRSQVHGVEGRRGGW